MRLRLLVACSCIPLSALIVWAGGGTARWMLLVVLIVYACVLGYALLFEGRSEGHLLTRRRRAAAQPDSGAENAGLGSPRERADGATQSEPPLSPEQAEPEPSVPPVPRFERPASLLAGIASRVGPQAGLPPAQPDAASALAVGRWNVWALERLATERPSGESDYERSLLLVYLRDFASSDGTLPPELDGFVESAFPDLIGELAVDRR